MATELADVGVVACGALARHVSDVARDRRWTVRVYPLPPLLHNRPERIAPEVDAELTRVRPWHDRLFVAYAECGTGGALEEVLTRHGVQRLPGSHCYDVFAGVQRIAGLLTEEPGTYFLTDYLLRSFARSVVVELGLDRFPELREDYFGNYRRVVWLAQDAGDGDLVGSARAAAAILGLPLTIIDVGVGGLAAALMPLRSGPDADPAPPPWVARTGPPRSLPQRPR